MAGIDRISVSPASGAHSQLLWVWAKVTNRSVSNLTAYLLETAINQAIRNGEVPQMAIERMNEYIVQMEAMFSEEYQEYMNTLGITHL